MLVGLRVLGAPNPGMVFKRRGRFRQDFPESVFIIRGGLIKGGREYFGFHSATEAEAFTGRAAAACAGHERAGLDQRETTAIQGLFFCLGWGNGGGGGRGGSDLHETCGFLGLGVRSLGCGD